MAPNKEKNKETDRANRMAILRKEVLREIKKIEKQEELKKNSKVRESKKKKMFRQLVEQKKDVDKKLPALSKGLKKEKDNPDPQKNKKTELSANEKSAERKIKVETAPSDIKTNKVNVAFGSKGKKSEKEKQCCFLNNFSKKDKDNLSQKESKQHSKAPFMFFVGLVLGCLLILFIGFCVPKSESSLVRKISKAIPFPAIIIDGKPISYNYFLQEADMVNIFLMKQKRLGIIRELPARKEIRENIKNLLIRQEIIKKLAVKHKVKVSEEEIKDEIEEIKKKSRSEESVEQMLKDLYGWSEQDFGNKVIGPSLLSYKLAKKIFPDVKDDEAKEVLDKKIESEKSKIKIYVLTD